MGARPVKLRAAAAAWMLACLCSAAWAAAPVRPQVLSGGEGVRLHEFGESGLDALLADLHRRLPSFEERVLTLARLYRGAPYAADPLTNEARDWLPYRTTNCTMYVLTLEAFANSRCLAEAREHMRRLHYRGGRVGFRDRYHFTADRITAPDNRYFAEATEAYVRGHGALRRISLELNRKRDGTLLFGQRLGSWSRKVTLPYVPRAGFSSGMLKPLPRVLGIAFVKRENWDKGIIVGHEGLLIDGDLYHASPGRGVVCEKDYLAAGFPESRWEGFIFFKLAPVSPVPEVCP